MGGKLTLAMFLGTMLCACAEPAAYWADVCEDMAAGKGAPGEGRARVERAVVVDLGDTAAMLPDMKRYPQCRVPVGLEFSDDVELNEMDKLRLAGGGAIPPVSISGRGEWKQIAWGDVYGWKIPGFAVSSTKVLGAAEISGEARVPVQPKQ